MRLHVLVEGQTEEQFIKDVLEPHLRSRGVWVYPLIVETSRDRAGRKHRGGGDWMKWYRDLQRLTGQHKGADARCNSMFDVYGLPDNFPSIDVLGKDKDTLRRAVGLEQAMAEAVNDWRLIPYLQRHEFEALVFAALDVLETLLEDAPDLGGVRALKRLVETTAPEDVNDGEATAPSKRLEASIPSYRKTVHGPLAVGGAGLDALRTVCPRFHEWVTKLEKLGLAE